MTTDRMSAADYLVMMAGKSPSRTSSSSRMMRLPADFVVPVRRPAGTALPRQDSLLAIGPAPIEDRTSSAEKARRRVSTVADALESARTDVVYELLPSGQERVTITVSGGETLPPNRMANIGRETAKISQRVFSRYKHACANRMEDAAVLLRAEVVRCGRTRFNSQFGVTTIRYIRQVDRKNKQLDEDAVTYSFKYILDGLVRAGVLVDDSRKHVRLGEADQMVGAICSLTIELTT